MDHSQVETTIHRRILTHIPTITGKGTEIDKLETQKKRERERKREDLLEAIAGPSEHDVEADEDRTQRVEPGVHLRREKQASQTCPALAERERRRDSNTPLTTHHTHTRERERSVNL
jgi:hypothetical protein